MAETNLPRVYFEGSQPIFRVENMQTALRFYVDTLGFTNADWGSGDFTSVNRDRAAIYLCMGGQGRGGAWAWIGIDDVRKFEKELAAKNVKLLLPPTNFPWALEMQIEDPDGNVLRFGSEPE